MAKKITHSQADSDTETSPHPSDTPQTHTQALTPAKKALSPQTMAKKITHSQSDSDTGASLVKKIAHSQADSDTDTIPHSSDTPQTQALPPQTMAKKILERMEAAKQQTFLWLDGCPTRRQKAKDTLIKCVRLGSKYYRKGHSIASMIQPELSLFGLGLSGIALADSFAASATLRRIEAETKENVMRIEGEMKELMKGHVKYLRVSAVTLAFHAHQAAEIRHKKLVDLVLQHRSTVLNSPVRSAVFNSPDRLIKKKLGVE